MSIEIKYIGGSMDGQIKRTRSTCDCPSIQRFVWREFDNKTRQPTGNERCENYKLDHQKREYILQGDTESSANN
jgi:hypothetical protein